MLTNSLPNYLIKIIANYLDNRTAKIRVGGYTGAEFNLDSGVPQGGCLSPTLFNFYTHDIPNAEGESINVAYADDITQIIRCRGTEKMLARRSAREIEKINISEGKWKIKTNADKFQIIPFIRQKTEEVKIGNKTYNFTNQGKVLGLTITRHSFVKHVSHRINLARMNLRNLYRFRELNPSNKRILYYALVKSVLVYPTVPMHTISKTQQKKLQTIQNKCARLITGYRLLDHITNEIVNEDAQLEPINLSLHNQANRIWEKIIEIIPNTVLDKLHIHENRTEMKSLPSSKRLATETIPLPIYR
jgi:hypothetical protein